MLSYDEEDGIIWIHPLFGARLSKEGVEKHSIVATVDDCDCEECDITRGPIGILTSLLLYLPTEYGMVMQRLTPSEAKALGNALIAYANDITELNEVLENEG